MLIPEFSTQFDVLFNNVTSNQAPGLNEYEKSVFLTKAERQLVREHFNRRVDATSGGFDGSQQRQYDFSCLLRTESLYNINTYADRVGEDEKLDKRSLVFLFPENYFLAVNELLSDGKYQYSVLPIDYSEYQTLMLKPYSFPVKRGAWRLITDKKNCNFYREYVTIENSDSEEPSETDYVFLSTWADQKRNLEVTISFARNSNLPDGETQEYPSEEGTEFYFLYKGLRCKMYGDTEWDSNNMTYIISVYLEAADNLDDEEVIEALKQGFKDYANITPDFKDSKTSIAKICRHTDGFIQCSAPSKFTKFRTEGGYTFQTKCIQLPMAEIIGKFKGEVTYKMRYVRTLKPIILEELSNYEEELTIDGYSQPMECELPAEMHEEILERAVTLAKIAWQGGTSTLASQPKNDR